MWNLIAVIIISGIFAVGVITTLNGFHRLIDRIKWEWGAVDRILEEELGPRQDHDR